jgi:hypothetical protein
MQVCCRIRLGGTRTFGIEHIVFEFGGIVLGGIVLIVLGGIVIIDVLGCVILDLLGGGVVIIGGIGCAGRCILHRVVAN